MRFPLSTRGLFTALVFGAFSVAGVVSADGPATPPTTELAADAAAALKDEIVKAWKARRESAHSYCFDWTMTETRIAGSGDTLPGPDGKPVRHILKRDSTAGRECSLKVSGKGIRYAEKGQRWSMGSGKEIDYETVRVIRADEMRVFRPVGPEKFPTASVSHNNSRYEILMRSWMLPIIMNFEQVPAFDPRNMMPTATVESERRQLVMARCVVTFIEWWLDRERDFVPVRMVSRHKNGSIREDLQISYRALNNTWIPSKWRLSFADENGTPEIVSEIQVGTVELNCEVSEEDLALEFPPGTWVREGDKTYVVLTDGSKRMIKRPQESMKDYDRIMGEKSR